MKHLITFWLLCLPLGCLRGQTNEAILSAVSVLTIHVSDTNTHDGVFRLLVDVLKLPVDYYPETHGARRYAAVYAGNLFIEPCGPFATGRYPAQDFKALFFGLNCISEQPPAAVAAHLDRWKIAYEKSGPKLFRVQDVSIASGLYLGINSQAQDKAAADREASLRAALVANNRDGLELEYIKEIWLGYAEPSHLQAWSQLLGTANRVDNTLWRLNRNQSLRFVKSEVRGVRAIVCKVKSIEQAKRYLQQTHYHGRWTDGKLELDREKTFGLAIYLAGE